jgi:hypothetical protein
VPDAVEDLRVQGVLRAEKAALEREIARLHGRLAQAEARLERARAGGRDPRGFGWGVAAGCLLVGVTVTGLFLWVVSAIGHMD